VGNGEGQTAPGGNQDRVQKMRAKFINKLTEFLKKIVVGCHTCTDLLIFVFNEKAGSLRDSALSLNVFRRQLKTYFFAKY